MQKLAMFQGFPVVVVLLVLFFVDAIDCSRARGDLHVEENSSLKKHGFNIHMKAVVKTIKEEGGDIFDCIDINMQPSLKHPLLKNHKIQMQPNIYPYFHNNQELPRTVSHAHVSEIVCPDGTTPIRRTKNQGFMRNISFSFFGAHQFAKHPLQDNPTRQVQYFAVRGTSAGSYYGGKVSLSIHEVKGINHDQYSAAAIAITDRDNKGEESDGITAGWMVYNQLYGDNRPRLTGAWNRGCYNMLCRGFVQVSKTIGLGIPFKNISSEKGNKIYMTIMIHKDPTSKNWWLTYGEKDTPMGYWLVGYWPSSLFTTIKDSAGKIITGGIVESPQGELSPSMGSGHFPNEERAAFARRILIVNQDASLTRPTTTSFPGYLAQRPDCYKLGELQDADSDEIGLHFYYGGPGKCTG